MRISDAWLIQGDCLKRMSRVKDHSVDMILCDLPYGTTACKWDTIIPFEPLWEHYKRIIKPKGVIVLTASQPFTSALIMSNPKWFKYCLVWEKTKASNFVHANYQPLKSHEDIVVLSEGGAAQGSGKPMTYNPQYTTGEAYSRGNVTGGHKILRRGLRGAFHNNVDGSRFPRSVIKIANPSNTGHAHPTQKPVALMEYMIRTYTHEGETVMDNCMGSGTTGVACANLKRKFIGIEKDTSYFEIARKRIENAQRRQRGSFGLNR